MDAKHTPGKARECAECRNGQSEEHPDIEQATCKVSVPAERPGLRRTLYVCEDHAIMLAEDYGDDYREEGGAR